MTITLGGPSLHLELDVEEHTYASLRAISLGSTRKTVGFRTPLVEVLVLGRGRGANQTRNLVNTVAGHDLRYVEHSHRKGALELTQITSDGSLEVRTIVELSPEASAVRFVSSARNLTAEPLVIEAFTPVALPVPFAVSETDVFTGSSSWCAENRWRRQPLGQAGVVDDNSQRMAVLGSASLVQLGTSTWTTDGALPVGVLEHRSGSAWAWQVEHNGPWRWEIDAATTVPDRCILAASGPTDLDHQARIELSPGEVTRSAALTIAFSDSGWQGAVAELTRHRRHTVSSRTSERGRTALIFNDYMNTINADPTTEKLIPLIDAASEVGAEYFCIDAGWYDETGDWWPSVGEWKPSTTRFGSTGLQGVLDHVVEQGMVPGLWLEPEVVGVDSPLADALPQEAFFSRHGHRVVEFSRCFLDLRSAAAREHLDETFDRLIAMGVGFFKLDYNVTPGSGTDHETFSVGAGLAESNQAYLEWFEALRERHPGVLFENCGSGAMRQDWVQVSRFDLQSTSDQQDFMLYPPIAASAPMLLLPEQCGNWAYAQPEMSLEEIAFVHVTGLSGRSYFSGFVDRMDAEQKALVREAADVWKRIRDGRAESVPFWPTGLPAWEDEVLSVAFVTPGSMEIAVWNRGEATAARLSLPAEFAGGQLELVYPANAEPWDAAIDGEELALRIPTGPTARLYRVS